MAIEDIVDQALKEVAPEAAEAKAEKWGGLVSVLTTRRTEAINARRESGIESIWKYCEEAYQGLDAANAKGQQFGSGEWVKPPTSAGPLTRRGGSDAQSTAYVRLTSRYVDAGYAKVCEIALSSTNPSFSFMPTPVPELSGELKDETPVTAPDGTTLERDPKMHEAVAMTGKRPEELAGASMADMPGVPLRKKDLAAEKVALATEAAKKAQKRVHDWMVESNFRAEMRKIVFDGARLGVGVLKGPYSKRTNSKRLGEDGVSVKVLSEVKPAFSWVSPWSIYPDPACGERICDGEYLFELDFYSRRQVRALKGQPGVIGHLIDEVVSKGPKGISSDDPQNLNNTFSRRHQYRVWFYHGTLTKDEYALACEASGTAVPKDVPESVPVLATIVDDTLVRVTMGALDSGEITYYNFPWSRREGHWAGVGPAEQLEMPQSGINAAVRAMFNNAGKSAGSLIALDDEVLEPRDGSYALTPDKLFTKKPGATMDDVRKSFAAFEVPNRTPQLMNIVEFCLRIAEEVTNIPLVTQGQSGKTTPETFGGMALQNNNANQLLRSIGYALDEYLIEPAARAAYEYLMLDPDVPVDEKGDWKIEAHGSSALVEQAIQNDTIEKMGNIVLNPAFGVDPKRWFAEFSESKHLNPKKFQYSEEEQQQRDAAPPPPPPNVQVAQIRSADNEKALQVEQAIEQLRADTMQKVQAGHDEVRKMVADINAQLTAERIRVDTDRDTAYVNAETERVRTDHEGRMQEIAARRELEILKYANQRQIALDEVKKDLAKTEMTLRTQKELAGISQVAKAAAEPPGKAANGSGFTQ